MKSILKVYSRLCGPIRSRLVKFTLRRSTPIEIKIQSVLNLGQNKCSLIFFQLVLWIYINITYMILTFIGDLWHFVEGRHIHVIFKVLRQCARYWCKKIIMAMFYAMETAKYLTPIYLPIIISYASRFHIKIHVVQKRI